MKTFNPLFLFLLPLLLVGTRAFSLHRGNHVPRITSCLGCAARSTRRLRVLVEDAGVDFPDRLSEGEQDGTTAPSLLYGTTGVFGYALGLRMACTLPALSRGWLCSLPVLILASYAIARSTLPFAKGTIKVSDGIYARNFGAHIFSASALPILASMMSPVFCQAAQKSAFLFGLLLIGAGSVSEILAHFLDSWVFEDGCKALQGMENAVFYIGLTGAFSFFALAFSPSLLGLSLASIPTAFLVYRAATRPWLESKGLTIAANAISTAALCALSVRKFRSAWPLLLYFQSVNIVRNSKRIIATEKQNLHLLPSAYGWFSYVFPFALSLHPATRAASLWTVLGSCALTVVGTDFLEQRIIEASTTTIEEITRDKGEEEDAAAASNESKSKQLTTWDDSSKSI